MGLENYQETRLKKENSKSKKNTDRKMDKEDKLQQKQMFYNFKGEKRSNRSYG